MPQARVRRRQLPAFAAESKYYNPDSGHLTLFALSAGYIEEYQDDFGCVFRLFHEDGMFHIRGRHVHSGMDSLREPVRETFDSVRSARQFARLQGTFQPASDAFSGI